MAIHKENDWLLAKIGNPTMSVDAFEEVGLNATNTSIESEQDYAETQAIQNMPEFQTDGTFDSVKFHKYYTDALADFNQLARDTYAGELKTAVSYYKDDIFAPKMRRDQEAQRNAPETFLVNMLNPDKKIYSSEYIGQISDSEKSTAEIMQENRVLLNPEEIDAESGDFSNAKWGKSINDMSLQSSFSEYFKSWGNTYVQARWKEDGVHIDPISGERTQHKKGQPKLSPSGDYYYEVANGRDIAGEQVLSRWDYLTVDGTKANTFDFMDSDDKQKSWEGTLAREVVEIAPLFIPYVGGAYMFLRLSSQLGSLAATAGKMVNDNFDLQWKWANSLEAFTKSLEQGTSEYSQQNSFTAENLISMVGQVGTQLLEQRALFKAFTALRAGGKDLSNSKTVSKLAAKYREQYLENAKEAHDIEELVVLSQKYAESEIKALQRTSQYFGEEASRLWMTGYTVMDSYNEAKENGATDLEAAMLTLGYSAMEYGILRTDIGRWILPEQKYERTHLKNMLTTLQGSSWKESQNLVDPNIKMNKVKALFKKGAKACKLDYMAHMSSNPTMRELLGVMASNALGEGIEETTEELAYDVSRAIGNAVAATLGSDTDFKPFEHSLERYSMSFLGGMFGGAVAQADPSFLKALKFDHNMTYDHAFKEFVGMIGEGKANDLKKMIRKLPINNQFLTKTDPKVNAVTMQETQGDVNDNMDKKSKQILLDMVDFCQNILDKHDANLTQSQLLRQSTYLRDLQTDALANSSFAASFVRRFNDARAELIKAEIEYAQIASPALNDATDRNAKDWESDHKAQIAKARKNLEEADAKVKSFFDGSQTPLLVRGVMKEMMPDYIRPYGIGNIEMYAQALYDKPYSELSDYEKTAAKESWEAFKSEDHQDHMEAVDKVTQGMAKLVAPLLNEIKETYLNKFSENPQLKKLREIVQQRGLFYGTLSDEGALRATLNKNYPGSEGVIASQDYRTLFNDQANQLLSKGAFKYALQDISLEEALLEVLSNGENGDAIKKRIDEIQNYTNVNLSPEELQKEKANLIRQYIGELTTDQLQSTLSPLVEQSLSQGFIDPESQSIILQGLDFAIERNKAWLGGTQDAKVQKLIADLTNQKQSIKNLPLIPILSILDKFQVNVQGETPYTISGLIDKLETILAAPELESIVIDDITSKALDNAIHLLEMFNAQVLGATIDDIDLQNRFSLNKMINDLEAQYNIKDKSNLATISSITAQQIRRELMPIFNKLKFMQALGAINSGQIARDQNIAACRGHVIMYKKVKNLLGNITDRDKWNKDGALDKLNATMASLEMLQDFPGTSDMQTFKEIEKQRIAFEDAIYDFMKTNDDKSWGEKASLFQNLNFASEETEVLNTQSKDLSDTQFMYWFMAASMVKCSSFLDVYKKAYLKNPKIAPFAAQEVAIRMLYSQIVSGDTFAAWTKATIPFIEECLKKAPEDVKHYLHIADIKDSLCTPRFFNTFLIEGVAGSGKTSGVLGITVAMLKELPTTAHLLKNAWICNIDEKSADNIGKNTGLSGYKTYTRKSLLEKTSGNFYKTDNLTEVDGVVQYSNYIKNEATGIYINEIPIDENLSDIPSIIIIDEVGKFTTDEIQHLDTLAAKYGIFVICLGDFNQSKTHAAGKASDDKDINSTLARGNFIHSPKLGQPIRAANNLKLTNQKLYEEQIPSLYKQSRPEQPFKFRYFTDDKGFYGDYLHIVDDYAEPFTIDPTLRQQIDIMFTTAGTDIDGNPVKIGVAYNDQSARKIIEFFLNENNTFTDNEGKKIPYKDRIELFPNGSSQGKESDYYIVIPPKPGANNDSKIFWEALYTGMTRARKGCIEILPVTHAEIILDNSNLSLEEIRNIFPIGSIRATTKVDDTLTQLTIDKISTNRKEIIEAVLPERVDPIKFIKRDAAPEITETNSEASNDVVTGEDGTPFSGAGISGQNVPLPVTRTKKNEKTDKIFELIAYSHAVHETGKINWSTNEEPQNASTRYDNIHGLRRINALIPESAGKLSLNQTNVVNILEKIRKAVAYDPNYVKTIGRILKLNSLQESQIKLTFIKYQVTDNPKGTYALDEREELLGVTKKGDNREIVASNKLGITIYDDSAEQQPLLFVPLMVLPNCRTIIESSDFKELHSSLTNNTELVNAIRDAVAGKKGALYGALKILETLKASGNNDPAIVTLDLLLNIWNLKAGQAYQSDMKVSDFQKLVKPTGPYLDTHEKGTNYGKTGYASDTKADMIYNLDELVQVPGLVVSEPLISYTGVRQNGQVGLKFVDPGKPFVLVSDGDVNKDTIIAEFNGQMDAVIESFKSEPGKKIILNAKGEDFYDDKIDIQNRRIKVVYIVPPKAPIKEYLKNLVAKLQKQNPEPIGNDFDPFRLFLAAQELVGKVPEGNLKKALIGHLKNLQKYENELKEARDRNDDTRAAQIVKAEADYLKKSNWKAKSEIDKALVNMYSEINAENTRVLKDNSEEILTEIAGILKKAGITEISYNPKADIKKNEAGVIENSDIKPVVPLKEGLHWTINGTFKSTAFFGDFNDLLESFIPAPLQSSSEERPTRTPIKKQQNSKIKAIHDDIVANHYPNGLPSEAKDIVKNVFENYTGDLPESSDFNSIVQIITSKGYIVYTCDKYIIGVFKNEHAAEAGLHIPMEPYDPSSGQYIGKIGTKTIILDLTTGTIRVQESQESIIDQTESQESQVPQTPQESVQDWIESKIAELPTITMGDELSNEIALLYKIIIDSNKGNLMNSIIPYFNSEELPDALSVDDYYNADLVRILFNSVFRVEYLGYFESALKRAKVQYPELERFISDLQKRLTLDKNNNPEQNICSIKSGSDIPF